MKAEELARNIANETWDIPIGETAEWLEPVLKDWGKEIAKEQREICSKVWMKGDLFNTSRLIREAKEPEL